MLQEFKNIRLFDAAEVDYILSPDNKAIPTNLYSPALDVFTDFVNIKPVTVSESMPVLEALEYMKSQHVRLLFVLDNKDAFAGIITAGDAGGRKVMAFMQKNQVSREQVQVRHIMLSKFNIKTLTYTQLCDARVGDVMLTMKDSGDQHVVVIDESTAGVLRVRGIISSSDISRRLKISFDIMYEAKSFAEIENALTQNGGF
ncbi:MULTISPECIES: CBS domain-containing protein [unclassified Neptuniibacter]|jgi:CBS domain-containing protein|uniref:CBS domain-containing protein n=1 Tax=unclassified Neptuniibacter TaxID=2630693 RepID=UPI0026E37C4A|nr:MULTISPECIES: CBS domain-containing protein [unclassified Neptuniibacter]MDO6513451.1 CBS domain-containing protein [Neptuniibacter sp. 2_MG-2023]MDO6593980.1 CBS domain-containing protein [Neptuniibacter sp. 1_MG-2023]